MSSTQQQSAAPCRYCRSEIPAGATVCATCNRSQSRLGNWVIWASGAVTLFAFIGSAALYLYSATVLQYERMNGADIKVRNVSSMKTLTLFNNSSADVLIEHIEFTMPGDNKISIIVDEVLDAGDVSHTDIGSSFEKQTTGPFLHRFGRGKAGRQVRAVEVGKGKVAEIVSNMTKADYGPDVDGRHYTVEAINEGGTDYILFGGQDSSYARAPCEMRISYQVARGGRFSLEPPCVGIVKYRKT